MYAIDKHSTPLAPKNTAPEQLAELFKAYKLNAVRLAELADLVDDDFEAQTLSEAQIFHQQAEIMKSIQSFNPTSLYDVKCLLDIWKYETKNNFLETDLSPADHIVFAVYNFLNSEMQEG